MQGNRRQLALKQSHILDDQGVDTDLPKLPGKAGGLGKLTIIEDGVQSNIDPRPELMGNGHQFFNIRETIGGGSSGTKLWATDVNGIGTVVDGGNATGKIFGRGQQFEGPLHIFATPGSTIRKLCLP